MNMEKNYNISYLGRTHVQREVFRYRRICHASARRKRTVAPSYNDQHWTATLSIKSSFENEHMHFLEIPEFSPNAIAMTLETTWNEHRRNHLSNSGEKSI
jgi:hypothetical protein